MENGMRCHDDELVRARMQLTHHALSYVKSVALGCAAQLGFADAIHRAVGGRASPEDLLAALSLSPTRLPHLRRLMRVLAASGIFKLAEEDGEAYYRLTPASTLLLSDGKAAASLLQLVRLHLSPFCLTPAMNLAEWLTAAGDGGVETAFEMTHGADLWGVCGRDAEFNAFFAGAMASDARFVVGTAIREMGHVFEGINTLVDVGGGTGTAATAVATAFPDIKCTVLDLPQVVNGVVPACDGRVKFVGGDMMEFIPRVDALLLTYILHDWSDKDCVTILKRCKEAIPSREDGGRVIIIDMVVGSPSEEMCNETQLLFDLYISTMTTGMERNEKEWSKLFKEAGFSKYKITPILGLESVIEVFP